MRKTGNDDQLLSFLLSELLQQPNLMQATLKLGKNYRSSLKIAPLQGQ